MTIKEVLEWNRLEEHEVLATSTDELGLDSIAYMQVGKPFEEVVILIYYDEDYDCEYMLSDFMENDTESIYDLEIKVGSFLDEIER